VNKDIQIHKNETFIDIDISLFSITKTITSTTSRLLALKARSDRAR